MKVEECLAVLEYRPSLQQTKRANHDWVQLLAIGDGTRPDCDFGLTLPIFQTFAPQKGTLLRRNHRRPAVSRRVRFGRQPIKLGYSRHSSNLHLSRASRIYSSEIS